jgi:hypothetical protein
MGVLIMFGPLLLGIALVANFRGLRDRYAPPAQDSRTRSHRQVALVVGWMFVLLPLAVLVDAAVAALTGSAGH